MIYKMWDCFKLLSICFVKLTIIVMQKYVRRSKSNYLGGWCGGEELRGAGSKETIIRIYCV